MNSQLRATTETLYFSVDFYDQIMEPTIVDEIRKTLLDCQIPRALQHTVEMRLLGLIGPPMFLSIMFLKYPN